MSRKNTCSFCHGVGHNRRGCEHASLAACLAPDVHEVIDLTSPASRKCSYCGLVGHNIRTCAGNKFVQNRKQENAAAITIQKYARRLIVYQTIEFPVDPYLGPFPFDSARPFVTGRSVERVQRMERMERRKPRTLPETRGVEFTVVETIPTTEVELRGAVRA
jgi:hypothetical protein